MGVAAGGLFASKGSLQSAGSGASAYIAFAAGNFAPTRLPEGWGVWRVLDCDGAPDLAPHRKAGAFT